MAIVVPDADVLEKYAREKNITGSLTELCEKKVIKDLIFNDMKQLEKASGLKGFEMVRVRMSALSMAVRESSSR